MAASEAPPERLTFEERWLIVQVLREQAGVWRTIASADTTPQARSAHQRKAAQFDTLADKVERVREA